MASFKEETAMPDLLDLTITLAPPPVGSPLEAIASIALRCDALGVEHTGDLLVDPITAQEHTDLIWYLEEYWKWPFEGFAERGSRVEELLSDIGKRLYRAAFSSPGSVAVAQGWRLQASQPGWQPQLSIASKIAAALSLPWELLHDEQGFLALRMQPVTILRRLPQAEAAGLMTSFTPPLRVLLVTARPEGSGFFDPRNVARELLETLQPQIDRGAVVLDFLRPPTLVALRNRLRDRDRPVHIFHFDGHGVFESQPQAGGQEPQSGGQGLLFFENNASGLHRVTADDLAQVLQGSGVRLAMLTACQSAMGAPNVLFSSVAARLIQSGLDAVAAMSTSVLVATTARYAEVFYEALAKGQPAPVAHEYARQELHADPYRHPFRRRRDEEGQPVRLRDWWLPHFYQQRSLMLQPAAPPSAPAPRLANYTDLPPPPRYGFIGRDRELLQIERWLARGKLVVIHGFGGMGKTALAREAADWLTRTGMYRGACFVSYEGGGDATILLSALGRHLNIYSSSYDPRETTPALTALRHALSDQPTLVIADNVEAIIPIGEGPLDVGARTHLWDVLLALVGTPSCGVLLSTRDTALGNQRLVGSRQAAHLCLSGLEREDAYKLASQLMEDLGIDRVRAPYAAVRDLLAQLDHHPLAIQLVLPTLSDLSLTTIRDDFAALLPRFVDDAETGRNRSLLASLEYSLRRLTEEQRGLLSGLAPFEGGATESDILAITEIPEPEWAPLRSALEQAALLTPEHVHDDIRAPFLRLHPVLTPFLRSQSGANDVPLRERYARHYHKMIYHLNDEDSRNPQAVRSLVYRELPNLQKALDLLLEASEVNAASNMAFCIGRFLTYFGLERQRDEMRQRVEAAVAAASAHRGGALTEAEWIHEIGMGEDELRRGNLHAAQTRFLSLLARIEALPADTPLGYGSYEHCVTLHRLALSLQANAKPAAAADRLCNAQALLNELMTRHPHRQLLIELHAMLLTVLGDIRFQQGQYLEAQEAYEERLQVARRQLGDQRGQLAMLERLGQLALRQQDYAQARAHFQELLRIVRGLGEPESEAIAWNRLGTVALVVKQWDEAERCFRKGLAISDQHDDVIEAASFCNQLAIVAEGAGRLAEVEQWYRRALGISNLPSHDKAAVCYNLALWLLKEVQAEHAPAAHLAEARNYADQALAIHERLEASSKSPIWDSLGLLADIVGLEGEADAARDYRRREREIFAAFEGNRYEMDQQHRRFIAAVSAAAQGDTQARASVETEFPRMEAGGWGNVPPIIRRIWAGERDWHVLAEELDRQKALLVLRILETIAQ